MKKSLVSTLALTAFVAGSLIAINLAPAASNAPPAKANPGDNTMTTAPGAPAANTTATTPMNSTATNASATTGTDMNKKTMKRKTAKKHTMATTASATTKKPMKKKVAKHSTTMKAQTANAPANGMTNAPAQVAPFTPPGGGNTTIRPNPAASRPNPGSTPPATTN